MNVRMDMSMDVIMDMGMGMDVIYSYVMNNTELFLDNF